MPPEVALDIRKILELLPHRFPFLLLDRVTEIVPGERLVALKNVTANEPWALGHWPGNPVFPGVLQLEAAFQAGGLLLMSSAEIGQDQIGLIRSISACFRLKVVPGDQLVITVTAARSKANLHNFTFVAKVGDEVACEGEFALVVQSQSEEDSDTGAL